jgi:hypothetical protein
VADLVFSRQFLRELAEWEGQSSGSDHEALESTLSAIASDPALSGRIPSFYDPLEPSYLYRSGGALIHYRVRKATVELLNLFFRRI